MIKMGVINTEYHNLVDTKATLDSRRLSLRSWRSEVKGHWDHKNIEFVLTIHTPVMIKFHLNNLVM